MLPSARRPISCAQSPVPDARCLVRTAERLQVAWPLVVIIPNQLTQGCEVLRTRTTIN